MKRKLGLVLLLGAWLGACATEPAPLNRTQPEAVNKAMFTGEWVYKMTVTDTDWDNEFTFTGEETSSYLGGAIKVRWEITQDQIAAYMIPQRIRDANGNLVENEVGQKSMVLAFPIKAHYDIRYRYNSTTREDLNVIEENTDRPWYEREYMEVDWSQNKVTNLNNPTMLDITEGNISREPVSVTENFEFFARGATKDEDYRIDTRKWNPAKDPEVYVMNIDSKETLTTAVRYWWQLYYGPYVPPVTTKIRHSLMKVATPDPANADAYQPFQMNDDTFRRFGFFRTEFETYDPERGSMETQKAYYANRWDLRGDRQVVWYASPQFQEQIEEGDTLLKNAAVQSIEEWNVVLREATGRTDSPMVFKENERLLDADGNPIYNLDGTQRWKYELGDMRYTFLNLIYKPQNSSPLGYGPSTPDSDTGEILSATVNCYGNWIDFVVRRTMDQYDVAAGHCTLDQVKDGFFYDPATGACDSPEWHGEYKGGTVAKATGALTESKAPATNPMTTLTPALMSAWYPKSNRAQPIEKLAPEKREIAKANLKAAYDYDRKYNRTEVNLAGMGSIAGTKYESAMIPAANLHTLAPAATSASDEMVLGALSPANRLSPEALAAMKTREIRRSVNMDDAMMFEPAIHAFVEEMKDKPRDEVYNRLREWIWYTTILHEMGHTIGLRHNFRASVDRENFSTDYWAAYGEYWDKVDALRAKYQAAIDDGDGAAYTAYVTEVNSLPATHNRFGASSIMDYMGDWVKWQYPVGAWDRAAILFGYGKKVETADAIDATKPYSQQTWSVVDYQEGDFKQHDLYAKTEKAASGRFIRYYHFCSDEQVFNDMFCTRFDVGTTATEITRNAIRDAQPSYFFKNFKRHSAQFDDRRNSYYINKWLWTYYMMAKPLAELTLGSMRYDEFWSSLWDGIENIMNGPETRDMKPGYFHDGGEDLLRAQMLTYYYFLYDVLGRPDYGSYVLKYDVQGKRFWEQTDAEYIQDGDIAGNIPAGPGWGWNDMWDVQADIQQYYPHLERIGVELDKTIVLEIMSIAAAFNDLLGYEKANGANYWNSLWTNNGSQLWAVIRGVITDNFVHPQNAWCMKCDAACQDDPANNPPQVFAQPVGLLEGIGPDILGEAPAVKGDSRCGADAFPVQPGMDALFAIQPIFYAIGGASHPWYSNQLSDYLDSQVIGGNHQYTPPAGAETISFVNSTGTKEYLAANTSDGMSISYQLVKNGRRVKAQADFVNMCRKAQKPSQELMDIIGGHNTCNEVLGSCYCSFLTCPPAPEWCVQEGWDSLYTIPMYMYRNAERVEALLIMMQDMIDIAGHFQWRVPGYLQE